MVEHLTITKHFLQDAGGLAYTETMKEFQPALPKSSRGSFGGGDITYVDRIKIYNCDHSRELKSLVAETRGK